MTRDNKMLDDVAGYEPARIVNIVHCSSGGL